jgi:Zn-dependent protease
MRWSIRLGSLFGIPVYLHFTFLLLLGGLAFLQLVQAGPAAALASLILVSSVFGLVVLHEMGHALAARRFGIGTRDVTLLPIGGVARLERLPATPRQELWIALAGPAVNLALAGLIGGFTGLAGLSGGGGIAGWFAAQLVTINLALFFFNMLPAFPMDGGRVLRALLARRMGNLQATEIAATVGKGMALLLGIAGLFFNSMLVFIAIFVWFGAGQELLMARGRAAMGRRPFFGGPRGEPDGDSGPTIDADTGAVVHDAQWPENRAPRPRHVRIWTYRDPHGY